MKKFAAWLIGFLLIGWAVVKMLPPRPTPGFDIDSFARLPVLVGIRVTPMDTLGRLSLLAMTWYSFLCRTSATISKLAWITQTPQEFDFENSHWSTQFHHTGPFHDGTGRTQIDFPWQRLTGEPLVYASIGTVQNGLENVFRTIAEAVGLHRDVQLVLSIGNRLDPDQIGTLPNNAMVTSRNGTRPVATPEG